MNEGRINRSALRTWAVGLTLAAAAIVVVVVVGPLLSSPRFDGWTVGGPATCPPPNDPPPVGALVSQRTPPPGPKQSGCDANVAVWLTAARDGFDRRNPDHPPVVRMTLHDSATSRRTLSALCCYVAVFELADGTVRAIGVGHIGATTWQVESVDYGPDK